MKRTLSLWIMLLTLLLFLGSLYSGYQSANTEASQALSESLHKTLSPLRELGSLPLLFIIFLNNSIKALLVILLGIVPFVLPASFIILNGFILGVVVNQAVLAKGLGFTLLGLLPHGIIELAAVLLAAALGLQISFASIIFLLGKKGRLGQQYKAGLVVYLKFILPALFLAAIIETLVGTYLLPHT